MWMPKSVGGQSVGGTCDIGWMKHENKCYKIHRTKKNWMTAQVKLRQTRSNTGVKNYES